MQIQQSLDITNLYITKSLVWQTIFCTPVTAKYMEKNLDITTPRYSEQILPILDLSLYWGSTVYCGVILTFKELCQDILSQHFETYA